MKVLAIDDSITVLELISTTLSAKGYEVAAARNGNEGLTKYREFKPDVVTLDLAMPGMDGYETFSSLKRLDNYVNVIMLTAANHSSTLQRCLKEGAIDFISKPFAPTDLVNAMERAKRSDKYCNHDTAVFFSQLQSKLRHVPKDSFFPDSSIMLKNVETVQNLTVDRGRYGSVQRQHYVPSEQDTCFVTRITGEKEGMVISMMETADLQDLFGSRDEDKGKVPDKATEFFNMINMKVVSELANSAHADIDGEAVMSFANPVTMRNFWNETARMWDRIEMGVFEMNRAIKTIPFAIQLYFDAELFK